MYERKMTSGEIANRAGISQKALRLYDEKGLLKPVGYSDGNYRLYDENSFFDLEKIIALKQIGFSLEEIREHLEKDKEKDTKKQNEISQILKKQMELMDEKILSLQNAKKCIQAILVRTDGNPSWEDATEIIRKMQNDQDATEKRLYAVKHQADNIDWYQKIFRSLEIRENDRILDLGCGYGQLWRNNWEELPCNIRVDCYDLHESHAEDFEKFLKKESFLAGTVIQVHWEDVESDVMWENLNKQKESGYHKVIAHYILHMVKDMEKLIKRISNALLSNGMFSVNYYGINAEYDYWEKVLADLDIHEKFVGEQRAHNRKMQENMKELLERYFRELEYVRLPGPLFFDDSELLFERLMKLYPQGRKNLVKQKNRLMNFFTQEINRDGMIILEADTGFWHCYK